MQVSTGGSLVVFLGLPQFDHDDREERHEQCLEEHEPYEDLRIGPSHVFPAVVMDWKPVLMEEFDDGVLDRKSVV